MTTEVWNVSENLHECVTIAVLVVGCESVTIEFVLKPVINGEKQSSPRAELSGQSIYSAHQLDNPRQSLIGKSREGNI